MISTVERSELWEEVGGNTGGGVNIRSPSKFFNGWMSFKKTQNYVVDVHLEAGELEVSEVGKE